MLPLPPNQQLPPPPPNQQQSQTNQQLPQPPRLSLVPPFKSDFKRRVKELFDNYANSFTPMQYIPPCTNPLNSGAFGQVCLSHDNKYAVKKIYLKRYETYADSNMDKTIEIIQDIFKKEVINYANISSVCKAYFCNLVGYKYDDAEFSLYIVMDYCGTDFFDYYQTLTPNNLQTYIKLLTIFKKIAEALNCLHQHNFIHFDVKPENIAIQDSGSDITVKLIDAGTLTHLPTADKSVMVHGTKEYMHPVLSGKTRIEKGNYLKKTDIYSYGVTVMRIFQSLSIFPIPDFITKEYTAEEIVNALDMKINKVTNKNKDTIFRFPGGKKSTRRSRRRRYQKRSARR